MEKNIILSKNAINHSTPKKISEMITINSLNDVNMDYTWLPIITKDKATDSNRNNKISLSKLFAYNSDYTNSVVLGQFSYSTSYLSYLIDASYNGTLGYINDALGYITGEISNLQIQLQYGAILSITLLTNQFNELLSVTKGDDYITTGELIKNNNYANTLVSYTKEYVDRYYNDNNKDFESLNTVGKYYTSYSGHTEYNPESYSYSYVIDNYTYNMYPLSHIIDNDPIAYTLTSYNMNFTNYRLGWQLLI